jgi:hypothetical protein
VYVFETFADPLSKVIGKLVVTSSYIKLLNSQGKIFAKSQVLIVINIDGFQGSTGVAFT